MNQISGQRHIAIFVSNEYWARHSAKKCELPPPQTKDIRQQAQAQAQEERRTKCEAARRDAAAALEAAQREAETQLQQAQAANAAEMETLRQQARKKQDRVVAAILDQLI